MSLRDDLAYMPDNELVFDYLDFANRKTNNSAEKITQAYPSLSSLMKYLSQLNARRLSPKELEAYQQGMAAIASAIAHHAELEQNVAETVI